MTNLEAVEALERIVAALEGGRPNTAMFWATNALTEARFAAAEYEEWIEGKAPAEEAWQLGGAQLLADLTMLQETVENTR